MDESENDFEPVFFDLQIDSCGVSQPVFPAIRIAKLKDGCMVDAVILDHGIPVLAYCVLSPVIYSLNVIVLEELGIKPGPWIGRLQSDLQNQNILEKLGKIEVDGKQFDIEFLVEKIFKKNCDRIFTYATDLIYSEHNVDRLKALSENVELLACESSFMEKDEERATAKKHLTDTQAKKISESIKSKNLKTFHYSKIYRSVSLTS